MSRSKPFSIGDVVILLYRSYGIPKKYHGRIFVVVDTVDVFSDTQRIFVCLWNERTKRICKRIYSTVVFDNYSVIRLDENRTSFLKIKSYIDKELGLS